MPVLREVNRWFDDFSLDRCATWVPCSVERKAHTPACVSSSRGLTQSCWNADNLIFRVTKRSFRAFDDVLLLRSTVLQSILAVPVLWNELRLSTLRLRLLILRPSLWVCVRVSCHARYLRRNTPVPSRRTPRRKLPNGLSVKLVHTSFFRSFESQFERVKTPNCARQVQRLDA